MLPEVVTDDLIADDLGNDGLRRFRDLIRNEWLLVLFDYWLALSRNGGMPRPTEIDPVGIPPRLLPSCMLIDVERGAMAAPRPFRLRFRLMGSAIVENRTGLTPRDPTGWHLDQVEFREGRERPLGFYGAVATGGCPAYHSLVYSRDNPRSAGVYHRLALPLSEDGREVSRLLAGFVRDVRF